MLPGDGSTLAELGAESGENRERLHRRLRRVQALSARWLAGDATGEAGAAAEEVSAALPDPLSVEEALAQVRALVPGLDDELGWLLLYCLDYRRGLPEVPPGWLTRLE